SYNHIVKFNADPSTYTQKTFYYFYINYQGFYGNNQFLRLADSSLVFGGAYYIAGGGGNTNYDFSILKTDDNVSFPVSTYHPPITAHGPTSWCDTSGSVVLTVPPGYRTYQWNVYPPDMDSSLVATASGYYNCTVTDEDGLYTSQGISVTETPIPVA